MTEISIVIVSYNEEENIGRCLDSLLKLKYPKDSFSILIVDGGSCDKTVDIARSYPVKLLVLPGANVAKCKNTALDMINVDYVAFIDADVIVDQDWLNGLVSTISMAEERVVAVGGPNLIMQDDYEMAKLIGHVQQTFLGSGGSPQAYSINKMQEVISVSNCNSLYRYSIANKFRFDEHFNIGDDLEVNFRLRLNGYKFIYVPSAIVYHRRPRSLKSLASKSKTYAKAAAKVTKKFRKLPRWYTIIPSIMFVCISLFPILYLVNTKFLSVYFSFIVIYILLLTISVIQVYLTTKTAKSLLTFVVLPIQHFYYGYGYIYEMIRGS